MALAHPFELYSQPRLSLAPKISLMNVLSVGSCRFQIHLCISVCIISSEFTRETQQWSTFCQNNSARNQYYFLSFDGMYIYM